MQTTLSSRLIRLTVVIILFSASLLPSAGFSTGAQAGTVVQQAPDGPSLVNPMWGPRYGHTATLLPDGTVLVTGGLDASGNPQASAEIFQPATGAWTSIDSMQYTRSGHTATLLTTGQVLVAGGEGAGNYTELYDPASHTWSVVSDPMGVTSRYGHTATLLEDGRLLVAGGYDGQQYLETAVIYDPLTGTWDDANDMAFKHAYHTATLLPDGTVLVYGGLSSSSTYLRNAEIFNPATGQWSNTQSGDSRAYHTATLLANGKVLVAGGQNSTSYLNTARLYTPGAPPNWTDASVMDQEHGQHSATLLPDGTVLVAGGYDGAAYTSGIEIYDPENDLWNDPGYPLAAARSQHTATLLPDGKLLIAGGYNGAALNSAELLPPDMWEQVSSMTNSRYNHTATLLLDGRVLVAGGGNTPGSMQGAELFDPVLKTFTTTDSMSTSRFDHTATLLTDGKVLVTGGRDGVGNVLNSSELFDPTGNTWTTIPYSMTVARVDHTATLLADGRVLITGGTDGFDYLNSAEIYDPATGTFDPTGNMIVTRSGHTATCLANGKVLLTGGWNGSVPHDSAELFDPSTGSFNQTVGLMITGKRDHTATLLQDGRVLVAGGYLDGTGALATAQIYDPLTGLFNTITPLSGARSAHTATLLADGRVLVAGGWPGLAPIAQTYDPVTGQWSEAGDMGVARWFPTATLLLNGFVLVAGGRQADLQGFSFATLFFTVPIYDPTLQPILNPLPGSQFLENGLSLTGSGWRGSNLSEASSGNTSSSPTNYPLVQLQSLGNYQIAWLQPDPTQPFTDSSYQSLPPDDFPPGYARLTVFVNAIPSQSQILLLKAARHAPIAHADPQVVLFSDGFENGFSGWQADGLWNLESQSDTCGSWVAPFPDPTQAAYYGVDDDVDDDCNYDVGYTSGSLTLSGTLSLPDSNWAQLTLWSYEQSENYYYYDRRYVEAYSDQGPDSLVEGRGEHTANLLPDGRVLVAGGVFPGYSTSAEIYDPATGVFTYTGAMNVQRRTHTATVLQDGRVLVVGGMDVNNAFFDSAEIYDPVTDVFTYTGSLGTGRNFHTATRLLDGKVLVTGGFNASWSIIDSAEIYDPATGVFTDTDSMDTPRVGHTATLLPDGKVLVVGGRDASNIMLASAEIYDPATGLFTPTGAMNQARDSHTATSLFDGKVLVIGGRDQNYFAITSAEIYDPDTGIFTPTGSMSIGRHSFSAVSLVDGRVLVAGGYEWDVLASAEIYDPAASTFSPTSSMQVSRSFFPAVALQDGSVLVVGGNSNNGIRTDSVELFLPDREQWLSKGWHVLSQLQNESGWYEASLDLTNFLGGQTSLRFRFDSIDSVANDYFGWMIDQVTVRSGTVYTTFEDTALSVPAPGVLGNDFDLDGDPLSASLGQDAAHGVVELSPDGSFTYAPEADYFGADDFTYIVSDGVLTGTARVMIEVQSVFEVDAGSNQNAVEGQSLAFNGQISPAWLRSLSQPQDVTILWDFGDGAAASGTLTPSHTYLDDGQYNVTLTVSDEQGASASDSLQVSVSNVAPQLDPLPDLYVIPGAALSLSGSFTDPGVLDAHTLTVEWEPGDSQTLDLLPGVTAFQLDHTYPADGVYTVSLSLVDDGGGQDSATFTVTVANRVVLPVVLR